MVAANQILYMALFHCWEAVSREVKYDSKENSQTHLARMELFKKYSISLLPCITIPSTW